MSDLTTQTVEEMIAAIAATRTGAIPDSMVYWSQAIGKNDPWAKAYVNTWEIEVNFDE